MYPQPDLSEVAEASRASQGKAELDWLLHFVHRTLKGAPKFVLELGVHRGYSLEVWQKAWPLAAVLGVDIDVSPLEDQTESCLEGDSHDWVTKATVQYWLSDSDQGLDFLFIDGDHTFEGVKQDYEMYSPLVRSGGVVAFHDACYTGHEAVQVERFVQTLSDLHTYQEDQNGVAVKVM